MALQITNETMLQEAQRSIENKIKAASRFTGFYADRIQTIKNYQAWCKKSKRQPLRPEMLAELLQMYEDALKQD